MEQRAIAMITATMWFKAKKQYRPGIDDPPPTVLDWLVRITGLAAMGGVIASWFKRRRP